MVSVYPYLGLMMSNVSEGQGGAIAAMANVRQMPTSQGNNVMMSNIRQDPILQQATMSNVAQGHNNDGCGMTNVCQGPVNPERAQRANIGMGPIHQESMSNSWQRHVNYDGSTMGNINRHIMSNVGQAHQGDTMYNFGQGPVGQSYMSNVRQGPIQHGATMANVVQGPSNDGYGLCNGLQGPGNPESAPMSNFDMWPMHQGSMSKNWQGPVNYEGSKRENFCQGPVNQRMMSNEEQVPMYQGANMSNLAQRPDNQDNTMSNIWKGVMNQERLHMSNVTMGPIHQNFMLSNFGGGGRPTNQGPMMSNSWKEPIENLDYFTDNGRFSFDML